MTKAMLPIVPLQRNDLPVDTVDLARNMLGKYLGQEEAHLDGGAAAGCEAMQINAPVARPALAMSIDLSFDDLVLLHGGAHAFVWRSAPLPPALDQPTSLTIITPSRLIDCRTLAKAVYLCRRRN